MSKIVPPRAIIDAAAGAGGPVHVTVFLAQAFSGVDPPALYARSDLHKCSGGGTAVCPDCTRFLAPAAIGQSWLSPEIDEREVCSFFSDVVMRGHLYQPAPAPKDATTI